MTKQFQLTEEIEKRIDPMGYCIATDMITVQGKKVGYMYREKPGNLQDSGWRFFSGDESDEYANDSKNLELYDVNTICNYDSEIIPFLDAPINSAFERDKNGNFQKLKFEK